MKGKRNVLTQRLLIVKVGARGLQNTKFCALLLFSVMIVGIFTLSPTFSSLMNTVVINSIGKISLSKITANSGSASDIQAAVNVVEAAGGGTVYIPSGTFYWNNETVNSYGGINIIGASYAGCGSHPTWTPYTATTILHNNKVAPFETMINVDGSNHKPFRISGIQFEGTVPSYDMDNGGGAIGIAKEAIDFRVDHCTFINFPGVAVIASNTFTGTMRGVIDHNTIDNPYKVVNGGGMWAYGVVVQGLGWAWDLDINHFLGKYETAPTGFPIVYIEDNVFSRCRHCVSSNQGAWYVARYNKMIDEIPPNYGSIDVHGTAGGGSPGGRGLEAYNNTIIGTVNYTSAQAFWMRGGGGVIFNNTMQNILYGVTLAADAPGTPYQVKDLYIWGNTMDRGTLILNNYAGYTENVDYFLSAKSGYTPYPYPHPLTLEATP